MFIQVHTLTKNQLALFRFGISVYNDVHVKS